MNAGRFDVERSADGKAWRLLGYVIADGNTDKPTDYRFVDQAPVPETNYYRLNMIDADHSHMYSPIITASLPAFLLELYPNPATTEVWLKGTNSEAIATIEVLTLTGMRVYRNDNVRTNRIAFGVLPLRLCVLRLKYKTGVVGYRKMLVMR